MKECKIVSILQNYTTKDCFTCSCNGYKFINIGSCRYDLVNINHLAICNKCGKEWELVEDINVRLIDIPDTESNNQLELPLEIMFRKNIYGGLV